MALRKSRPSGSSSSLASPTYAEAYPRISVGGLLREAAAGRPCLLWRDQADRIAGAAKLVRHDRTSLTYTYHVCDLVYEEEGAGEATLQLRWKGSRADNQRPYGLCSHCPREPEVMVFRSSAWACSACHRLGNRSAKLRKEIRWSEELAVLNQRLDASLDLSTSRQMRAQLMERRQALMDSLGDRRPTASVDYLRVLVPEYVAMPEM